MKSLPPDWYIEASGESRILDQSRVLDVIIRIRLAIDAWEHGGCGSNQPLADQLEILRAEIKVDDNAEKNGAR